MKPLMEARYDRDTNSHSWSRGSHQLELSADIFSVGCRRDRERERDGSTMETD